MVPMGQELPILRPEGIQTDKRAMCVCLLSMFFSTLPVGFTECPTLFPSFVLSWFVKFHLLRIQPVVDLGLLFCVCPSSGVDLSQPGNNDDRSKCTNGHVLGKGWLKCQKECRNQTGTGIKRGGTGNREQRDGNGTRERLEYSGTKDQNVSLVDDQRPLVVLFKVSSSPNPR